MFLTELEQTALDEYAAHLRARDSWQVIIERAERWPSWLRWLRGLLYPQGLIVAAYEAVRAHQAVLDDRLRRAWWISVTLSERMRELEAGQ